MEVKWKYWKNKKYLLNDFRGATNNKDLLHVLTQEIAALSEVSEKTPILSNYTNVNLTFDFLNSVKEAFKDIGDEKVSKSAIIGVTGFKKIMMDFFFMITGNKVTRTFNTEDSALHWIVS